MTTMKDTDLESESDNDSVHSSDSYNSNLGLVLPQARSLSCGGDPVSWVPHSSRSALQCVLACGGKSSEKDAECEEVVCHD